MRSGFCKRMWGAVDWAGDMVLAAVLLALAGLFLAAGIAGGQMINPQTQVAWPKIVSYGVPTSPCTSANYGQPFQNTAVTPNTYGTCGTDGWAVRGGSGGGGSSPVGPQYKLPAFNGSGSGSGYALGAANFFTDSTGNNLTVPGLASAYNLQNAWQASAYSPAHSNQGLSYIFNSICDSACVAAADITDPASDSIGQIEPNGNYLLVTTPPAGSSIFDYRAGGFGVSHFNAAGTTSLSYHSGDTGLLSTLNTAGYGTGNTSLYYDLNPGINGEGAAGVPTYGNVIDQDTKVVYGQGVYTFGSRSWFSNGTSDSNFDQVYDWFKSGNPQGSSEGVRVHQWNYTEEPAATGVVSAYSADQITFNGGYPNMLGVGQPLIDQSKAISNSANTGVLSTSGTTATWVSGTNFAGVVAGDLIYTAAGEAFVQSVQSSTSLTLVTALATQTDVAYTYSPVAQGYATLTLSTPVTASTATGNLAYPVYVTQVVENEGRTIPAYPTDFVLSTTGYNVGDLVNLNGYASGGSCCFIENVTLTGAVTSGTAWSSTATYTSANVRSLSGNLYQSNTDNTDSSPANSPSNQALSSIGVDGGGTAFTMTSGVSVAVGASITLSGETGTCNGGNQCALLNGVYTVTAVNSSTTFHASPSVPFTDGGPQGVLNGDWTLLGTATGTTVATANLRYPHAGGTACANGMVGDDMEVNSQSSVAVPTLGDYRYMQYITCSTDSTITEGAVVTSTIGNFGGAGLAAITLYPAADITGVVTTASQSNPTVLALTDSTGFSPGDSVEEPAQAYGLYNVNKEAYNFFNPNAQMNLHQIFLGGYAQNAVMEQINAGEDGIPSYGALTRFQFNVPVSTFAQFGAPPATIFDLCYGNSCGTGTTTILKANSNYFNYNAATSMFDFQANGVAAPAFNATSTSGNAVSTFTNTYDTDTSYGLIASQTSGYPAPAIYAYSQTGGYNYDGSLAFAPGILLKNLTNNAPGWGIGVASAPDYGPSATANGFVIGYNPTYSTAGSTDQTFTDALNITTAGVANFPLGLQEAGSTVCTAANYSSDCPSSGSAVSSVFGRTGAVTATTGDYAVAQVTGAAPLASPAFAGTVTAPIGDIASITAGQANVTYYPAACGSLATPPSWCSGSDMGAWINAAYAAGTSPVAISVDPGTYSFSTPIVFGTANKYVTVNDNGAALQYTGSTGAAITVSTGTSAVTNATLLNLDLTTTVSGATTTGIAIGSGGTNGNFMKLINPTINGFKTLIADQSYGAEIDNPTFYGCSSASGSIGVSVTGNGDDLRLIGGVISGCAINIDHATVETVWVDQTVLAYATTDDIVISAGGALHCTGCHLTNNPGYVANYLTSNGVATFEGSQFEDDATTGSITAPFVVTAGYFSNTNFSYYSAGESYSELVNFSSTVANACGTIGPGQVNYSGTFVLYAQANAYLDCVGTSPVTIYGARPQAIGGTLSDAYNLSTHGDRQMSLDNSDFEGSNLLPPPGWAANNDTIVPAYETTSPYTNKHQSLKFTGSSQYSGMEYLTNFAVVPGDTYSLACAMKGDGTSSPACNIDFWTATGGYVSSYSLNTSSTSWAMYSGQTTVPATAVYATILLSNFAASGAGTSWFDEISVQKTNFLGLSNALMQGGTAATIASATTIAPTTPLVVISGTTAIATITLPTGFTSGCFDALATGAWSTTTDGNIEVAMTAVANTQYRECYWPSISKWTIK